MKSTTDWIDAVKAKLGIQSDYALAKHWNVSRALISKYRTGAEYLSEETAAKVAADLEVKLEFVLACAAGERARMPSARAAWAHLAAQIGVVAFVVAGALLVTEPLFQESPYTLAEAACFMPMCIMSNPHIGLMAAILLIFFNVLPFIPNKKN